MTTVERWIMSVQKLLNRLNNLDLGYPIGRNEILPPQPADVVDRGLHLAAVEHMGSVSEFYRICDGVSLPDIHVGYFIKSVTRLGVVDPSSEPVEITGSLSGKALVVGSTGGGGLFAIRRIPCDVLYLAPGPLQDGVYDGRHGKVTQISTSFFGFLDRLLADIEAFVHIEPSQTFMC